MGKTTDGKLVVSGLFEMYDTHGVQLDLVLARLRTLGYVPCWSTFKKKSLTAGWNQGNLTKKLEAVVGDVYGPEYRAAWSARWGLLEATSQ